MAARSGNAGETEPLDSAQVDSMQNDTGRLFDAPPADAAEHEARATFTALMWALSYPGQIYELPPLTQGPTGLDACHAIGRALLDLETSYYTPIEELAAALAHTSARALPAAAADYHFYPAAVVNGDPALQRVCREGIGAAKVGNFLYPNQSATLILGCRLPLDQDNSDARGDTTRVCLRGPGIEQTTETTLGGLLPGFWELRAQALHYPLGWDLFLVDGKRVLGLPRTTEVEVIGNL